MPDIVVLAGPNGAGKTTAAPHVLRGALHVHEFVNADVIARGLSAFDPEGAAIDAGRIMLERLRHLTAERKDVAFETTLASRSFAPWIRRLIEGAEYRLMLFYFWLPAPEMAIRRVADRVAKGGHFVPEETIRRRYSAGLRNFFELYQPLAFRWKFVDNSDPTSPVLVAQGIRDNIIRVEQPVLWRRIQKECL